MVFSPSLTMIIMMIIYKDKLKVNFGVIFVRIALFFVGRYWLFS